MAQAVMLLTGVLLPVMLAAAFLLGRHLSRRQRFSDEISPVTRQHIDLFQGGQLSEVAVESAKSRLRDLLEQGDVASVEASLRPGTGFVIQVRALAEIGTDDAGRILERQLRHRLTEDEVEQSWYWIDLAGGLRSLNREESLPQLLHCAEKAGEIPLGHFFAAETVCFLSFSGYLRQPFTPLGKAALRVLHRAMEGLRSGVQPQVVTEARLGEMIETLWDHRPGDPHPLVARVFAETLRLVRRAPHAEAVLGDERADQEAFGWQVSRLAALEPALTDYLEESPKQLSEMLLKSPPQDHPDILQALEDLRAEAADVVLPLLESPGYPHAEAAVAVLAWSKKPAVGPWLRDWIHNRISVERRARARPCPVSPPRPSVPPDFPYRAILRALRGHPSRETEDLLRAAARDWDPAFRSAAVSSLGWWEPLRRSEVLHCLHAGRRDSNPEVRLLAGAALARLGERQALQWFRQSLFSENSPRLHEAIQTVAAEGIFLLWPDLDSLADAEDLDVALHARETLERLRETLSLRNA